MIHAGLGDQSSSPGTSSSTIGNGMRNLLGSCVRAFLVAGPARSSRSHGARVACGRRNQKKKQMLDCCFGCVEFGLVAQLVLDGHNTRDIGQGYTDALTFRGGRCTGGVSHLCTRVATPVSSSVIAHSEPVYNPYAVVCLRGLVQ